LLRLPGGGRRWISLGESEPDQAPCIAAAMAISAKRRNVVFILSSE